MRGGERIGSLDAEVHDAKIGQPAFPFEQHQMRTKHLDACEHHVRTIGHDLAPFVTLWTRDGRAGQPERPAARVGADEKVAADVVGIRAACLAGERIRMMVHVILMVCYARSNHAKLAVRLGRGQKPHFTRRVAGNDEQKKCAAAGTIALDAEALVGFFIDQRVRLCRTRCMTIEPVCAFCSCVLDGVEERPIVRRPSCAGDSFDGLREQFAAPHILDVQRELPESRGIQRISK